MRYVVFFFAIILCWAACTKYKHAEDDFGAYNSNSVRGRLFLYDTLTGNYYGGEILAGNYPVLTKQLVTLTYYPDISADSNYLFSAETDSNGYFIFNGLKGNTPYELHYTDTAANGLVYQANQEAMPGNDSVIMTAIPSSVNNGFWFYFTDSTQSGPIDSVAVGVFSNPLVFDSAGEYATYNLISDALGRAYLFNVRQGKYYLALNRKLKDTILTDTAIVDVQDTIVRRTYFIH